MERRLGEGQSRDMQTLAQGVPMPDMPRGVRGKAAASDKERDRQVYTRGPERDSEAGGRGRGEGTACGPEGRGLGA